MSNKELIKLIIKILIISLVVSDCYCGEDYYKLLGVSRSATAKEIKKAFKKMSLKWHPDKNKKDPERAKNMFIKIANAYEVLSDPKKKDIYDRYGEEGVKEQVSRENSGQGGGTGGFDFGGASFEDIFANFFGGGGGFGRGGGHGRGGRGGGRRSSNFNGGQGGGFNMNDDDDSGISNKKITFNSENIIKFDLNSISDLNNRREIWYFLFYKKRDIGIKTLAKIMDTLADKTEGIFKIATLNCESEEELCSEYKISSTPTVLYFPDNNQEPYHVYKGQKTWEAMFKYGNEKMQNFVRTVNEDNLENFLFENANETKIMLFTQRKTSPPLLKAISKFFKGKLSFAEVRETERKIVKRYGINKFPSIMVLTDPGNNKGVIYDGPLKRKNLDKFLMEFAYYKSPKDKKGDIRELDKLAYTSDKLCSDKDNKICIISVTNDKPDYAKLKEIADNYKNDPVSVLYLKLSKYQHFFTSFNPEDSGSEFIILRGKRKKYTPINNNKRGELYKAVDTILNGAGTFKNLRRSLNFISSKSDL